MTYHYSGYDKLPLTASHAVPRRIRAGGLYSRVFKRAFDLLFVAIVAVPVLAVVVPLAIMIAMDGGSPFYVQKRVGRNGRTFRMWKLRSMVTDADARLSAYLDSDPAARAEWDAYQKLRRDPRITPFGHLLRRTSLDELPQLWNVLTGDMSMVGPRPMMPSQETLYPGTEYYAMRPGITGFWQISVRNESNFAQRADFDRRYFQALSLSTDLSVILRTFRVVVKATGS